MTSKISLDTKDYKMIEYNLSLTEINKNKKEICQESLSTHSLFHSSFQRNPVYTGRSKHLQSQAQNM